MSNATKVSVERQGSSAYVEVCFSNTSFETFFVPHVLKDTNDVLTYLSNDHGLYASESQVLFV